VRLQLTVEFVGVRRHPRRYAETPEVVTFGRSGVSA
jgi:hypothetical protein